MSSWSAAAQKWDKLKRREKVLGAGTLACAVLFMLDFLFLTPQLNKVAQSREKLAQAEKSQADLSKRLADMMATIESVSSKNLERQIQAKEGELEKLDAEATSGGSLAIKSQRVFELEQRLRSILGEGLVKFEAEHAGNDAATGLETVKLFIEVEGDWAAAKETLGLLAKEYPQIRFETLKGAKEESGQKKFNFTFSALSIDKSFGINEKVVMSRSGE